MALGADGGDAMTDPAALRRSRSSRASTRRAPRCAPRAASRSNSAVVLDESVVLKLYRHIEPGPGIEAELLHGLQAAGFTSAPRLRGVLERASPEPHATLAIVTDYVASAGDGWELTLASLAAGDTAGCRRARGGSGR